MKITCKLFNNNSNKKKLFIFIHGYGASGDDFTQLYNIFSNELDDYYFIAPNAPHRCELSDGYQWFSLSSLEPELLFVELAKITPIFLDWYNDIKQQYNIQDEDISILGFSQGAMLALFSFLRCDYAPRHIIAHSGALIHLEEYNSHIINKDANILLIHGELDNVIPIEMFNNTCNILHNLDIPLKSISLPYLEHNINEETIKNIIRFIVD